MPFREGVRIAVENQHQEDIGGFFYQITYVEDDVPAAAGCRHAQWQHSMTNRDYPEQMLDNVLEKGHYPSSVTQLAKAST